MQDLGTLSPAINFKTTLPKTIVDIFLEELNQHDIKFASGRLTDGKEYKHIRDCKVATMPTMHWFSGFLWNYISLANRESFMYDITCVENETITYLEYEEGHFYRWHIDHDIGGMLGARIRRSRDVNLWQENAVLNGELVRKLSFSLQLSSADEYEGGELQLLRQGTSYNFDPKSQACASMITVPKELGLLTVFDSRVAHRVRKVKSGKRKSLVGWVVGPRWK